MSPRPAAVLLAILTTTSVFAATRMTYDIKGTPTVIEWAPTSFPLRYEIDQKLANHNPAAAAMVDKAFAAWAAIPDTNVRFQPGGVVQQVRLEGRVAVSLAEDLFRDQGALAVTTYTFDNSTGRFTDADIQVDPSLFRENVNGQMALQHEVGHVLGLDHSAVLSAIMYPFVGRGSGTAAFDSDDRIAIATSYPKGDPTLIGATLQGRVLGDGGGIYAAQVVAVNELGELIATGLTNSSGEFSLLGIPMGRYRLYAEPLDGPVETNSLQGSWRQAKTFGFPTLFFDGPPIAVENGRVYGNLVVSTGGPAQLNPKWVGACPENSRDLSLSTTPITVTPGQTVRLAVAGDGFTGGMTRFEVLNPAFRRVSDFEWSGNYVSAAYTVEPDARSGSSVILVHSGRDSATLTGALKIQRAGKTRAVGR
jgi:hypothetical protein